MKPFARKVPGAVHEINLGDTHRLQGIAVASTNDFIEALNEAFEEHTRALVAHYRELWELVQAVVQAWDEGTSLPRTLSAKLGHLDHLDPNSQEHPEYVPGDWLCGMAMAWGMAEGHAARALVVLDKAMENGDVSDGVAALAKACRMQNELLMMKERLEYERELFAPQRRRGTALPFAPLLSTMAVIPYVTTYGVATGPQHCTYCGAEASDLDATGRCLRCRTGRTTP